MSLLRAFLPGSGVSTAIGFILSLITYCLYWYLNTVYVVALVLIALPSIMAWLYTITLIALKHWKGLHRVHSPTASSFPHRSQDESSTNLLYLARWFAGLSVLHASCWWLLLILMLCDLRTETPDPVFENPGDPIPSNIDFMLICPSPRCTAFFTAMGCTIAAACVCTLQLICLGTLLHTLRKAPIRIVGSHTIGDLLNHDMETLLAMRERTRVHWSNGGVQEGSWTKSRFQAWAPPVLRRNRQSVASAYSEASFGNTESKHHLMLRSLPNRLNTADESRRRTRGAAPDSSGRLQRRLSFDEVSVLSFGNDTPRADPEIKKRDYGYPPSRHVHSPTPVRLPSLSDITRLNQTPSLHITSPTNSDTSDKPDLDDDLPPTGETPRATLGENRTRSASPSTPRASGRSLQGWMDASDETPRRAARELRAQLSQALDGRDDVGGLALELLTPKGSKLFIPPKP